MKVTEMLGLNRTFLMVTLLIASAPTMAGEYYKWVDEHGVSHFSERPPAQADIAEKIKTHARTPTTEEAQEAKTAINKELAPTTQTLADPARCDQEKARLTQLSSGSRIRMQDTQGGFYYLDEQQIRQEVQKSQQAIAESCK